MGTTAEITVPAEIAGIPTERLAPMRDGSVREYDRPVFTETEGVGRHQDPDARRVHIHAPGSEVAEALRPIMAERSKPRAVTRMDIACMEQARDIYAVQGKNDEAASCERMVYRMRAGFAISTRRQATPALAMRSQAVARPRERSDRRASSPSRAGPDADPDESEPAERRLCENKRCERDISHRPSLSRYCNDACQQEAWRDRRTIAYLDEKVGTIAEGLSCTCAPRHGDTEPHSLVEHGHCTKCGYTRGVLTRAWVDDKGVGARPFVSTRGRQRQDFPVRPNRKLSAKLRATKNDYVDESIIRRVAA